MQLYELYANICNPKYMQKCAIKNMQKYIQSRYMHYMHEIRKYAEICSQNMQKLECKYMLFVYMLIYAICI